MVDRLGTNATDVDIWQQLNLATAETQRRAAEEAKKGERGRFTFDAAQAAFDAKELAPEPLARVLLPARVPYGFHGLWAAAGQLG